MKLMLIILCLLFLSGCWNYKTFDISFSLENQLSSTTLNNVSFSSGDSNILLGDIAPGAKSPLVEFHVSETFDLIDGSPTVRVYISNTYQTEISFTNSCKNSLVLAKDKRSISIISNLGSSTVTVVTNNSIYFQPPECAE